MRKEIEFSSAEGIATITLNRPDDDNRMTLEVLERMGEIAQALAADTATQAVIVAGAGSQFFSGGMLHPKVRATLNREQILSLVRLANAVFDRFEALPQVTIVAMNGITRAAGAEFTLACDIRLAAAHATWALPEAKWGGFPGAGGPVRLPAIVGRSRALEIICTGRELDAAEMQRLGLTLETFTAEKLMAGARSLAGRIAACGPLAIRGAKRIVDLRMQSGFGAARELSDALRYALESTHDMQEGAAAILEGRKPRFKGN